MTPAVYYSLGIALLADRRRRALLVGFVEAGQLGVSAEIEQGARLPLKGDLNQPDPRSHRSAKRVESLCQLALLIAVPTGSDRITFEG